MTTLNIRQAVPSGTPTPLLDTFLRQFDGDEDGWYVMQEAFEVGLDPLAALVATRSARATLDAAPVSQTNAETTENNGRCGKLQFPPGFAGAVATYIYRSAPRPVVEVAIVAALGLLAGVCGREWNIPGSGLNLYLILVARSAIGKEAMHSGIAKILSATRPHYALADEFVCFDDFASGPALTKFLLGTVCAVNVAGEVGHKFAAMAKDTDPAMRSLRKVWTNTYSKSAIESVAGGIIYSNSEANARVMGSVAYSLIGESTPGTFYEALTDSMMRDGFMSRFNVVEYSGDRPDKNPAPVDHPEPWLPARMAELMRHAHTLRAGNRCQSVTFRPDAASALTEFETECDGKIREAGDDESQRQMWNRAHLKALRISALLSVADNHLFPAVNGDHAAWAIDLVRRDIGVFAKRILNGDVGEGTDDGRERRLLEICREWLMMDDAATPNYAKPWKELRKHGLVPRKYLQLRTQRIAAFEKHPRGQKEALDKTIQTAIDNGHFHPLDRLQTSLDYSFQGRVFAIVNTGEFQSSNWIERFLDDAKKRRLADKG